MIPDHGEGAHNPVSGLNALLDHPARLLDILFDRMPMGIAVFDRDLVLRRCNPTWASFVERYTKTPAHEVVPGKSFFDLAPGTEEDLMPLFERVLSGETVRESAFRLQSDGGPLSYWDVVFTPLVEEGRVVGFTDVVIDATERTLVETELRRSEERFRSLVQNSSDVISVLEGDGTRRYVSPSVRHVLGYEPEELVGKDAFDLVHPDDLPAARREIGKGYQEPGASPPFEVRLRHKDGSYRWLESVASNLLDDPGVGGVVVNSRDVTERRRVEQNLREKEEQYRRIFEESGDGLIINDLESGRVVEANPAICRMHGYDREEFVGLHPREFVHPDYHGHLEEYLQAVREGRDYQTQAVDVRKDGSTFPVGVHGTHFTFRGKPHVLGVVRDITDRVEAEQLLERRVEERTRELSALLEVSNNVASTLKLDRLLSLILDQLKTVVDYVDSSLLVVEDGELVVLEYRGPIPREKIMGESFPLGPAMETIWQDPTRPHPIIVDDIRSDTPLARAYRDIVGEERLKGERFRHIRSWLGVPLVLKGRFIGLLAIIHNQPRYYTRRHAELAKTVANQAAIAIENARLYEQAQSAAALEERQRLARELHDSVSQALYGIALGARTARTLLDRGDPERVAGPLDYVLSLAEAGLDEMRALIFELRPESLESEGLVAALEKRAAALRARHEIQVRLDLDCEPQAPLRTKETLYRIAQEALHNTVKHARATSAEIMLECDPEWITLEISDDGAGFDPLGSFPGHLGLKSMRERAARLSGTLEIESNPGKGTRIRARIPC